MGSHRLLFVLVSAVGWLGHVASQHDFYYWLESSTNNKPMAPTEPRGPNSCVWEEVPENGYMFTTCPSGICSDQEGSFKKNGTIRFAWCKKHYALARGSDRDICVNGSWTSSGHKCSPCGRSSNTATPPALTSGSEASAPGTFPWTAAIYAISDDSWGLACTGILASPGAVLTAGHCVRDVMPADVMVGLGTPSDKTRNGSHALVSQVMEIIRPAQFDKQARPTDQDVVMLVLSQTLDNSATIMPVCLDWTGSQPPKKDEIGFLSVWEDGDNGAMSKWGYKKFIDNDTCIKQLHPRDRSLLTEDKFCIEEAKGLSVGKGDGGGVTFVRDGAHYVYGVVSGKVEGQRRDYRLFTSLVNDKHRTWMQRNWRRLHRGAQKKQPQPQPLPLETGGCSVDSDCPEDRGCVGKSCVDLCQTACGANSDCTTTDHQPVCKCKPGYQGNAYDSCTFAEEISEYSSQPDSNSKTVLTPGDVCKQDGETVWTCKIEDFCPKAVADIKRGKTPPSCGTSQDGDNVVCCEPDVQPTTRLLQSKNKCRWYSQSVYSEVPSSSGGGFVLKDTCAVPATQPPHGEYLTFKPGEFPHLGIMGDESFNNWHYGNLISEQWFLTSAFCATKDSCTKKVRMGIYDGTNGDGQGLPEYDVIEKHIHPGYDDNSVFDSIGVYKLKTAVRFSQFIRPACLVPEHQFPGVSGVIIGELDDTLKKTTSTILPKSQCNITNTDVKDESMFCVDTFRFSGSIIMYSGFPMVIPLKEPYCMYGLVGMATYGAKDGPEGYMRLSHYVPWIENLVWPQ